MFKIIASLYLSASLDNMNLRYEGPHAKKGKDSEEGLARKILLIMPIARTCYFEIFGVGIASSTKIGCPPYIIVISY